MNIAIYADTDNLYTTMMTQHNKKLSYQKYLDWCLDLGTIYKAYAYVAQVKAKNVSFISCLRRFGYEIKTRRATDMRVHSWDTEITADCLRFAMENDGIDTIVLGSSSPELVPLVNTLSDINIKPIILACKIPPILKRCAFKCIEIPKSLTEDIDEIKGRRAAKEEEALEASTDEAV